MFGALVIKALVIKAQRVARIFYGVKRNLHYTLRFSSPIHQVIFTMVIVAIQMVIVIFPWHLFIRTYSELYAMTGMMKVILGYQRLL